MSAISSRLAAMEQLGGRAHSAAEEVRRGMLRFGAGFTLVLLASIVIVVGYGGSSDARDELGTAATKESLLDARKVSELRARLEKLEASKASQSSSTPEQTHTVDLLKTSTISAKAGVEKSTAAPSAQPDSHVAALEAELQAEKAHDKVMTKAAMSLTKDVEQLRAQMHSLESQSDTAHASSGTVADTAHASSGTVADKAEGSISHSLQGLKASMKALDSKYSGISATQQLRAPEKDGSTSGQTTQKLEPITEDEYQDLQREVKELQKREAQRVRARKDAISNALSATSPEACADSPDPKGCAKANEQIKWRSSQDKYERAAFTDIVNQDKGSQSTVAYEATQKEILHYKKLAARISGKKELAQIDKETAQSEKLRSAREAAALKLIRTEKKQLMEVNKEEMAERDSEAAKRQAAETAKVMQHIAQEGDQTMSGKKSNDASKTAPSALSDETGALNEHNVVSAGIAEEEAMEHTPHHSGHHEATFQSAKRIEAERQKAFHEQVAEMKKADLQVRKSADSLSAEAAAADMQHLTQYEKDEEAAMLKSVHAASAEEASRSKEVEQLRVHSAKEQKIADERAQEALEKSKYQDLGLSPDLKLAHVMSDDYRSDIKTASMQDAKRQDDFEKQIQAARAHEVKSAAKRQVDEDAATEQALNAQNDAAGYSIKELVSKEEPNADEQSSHDDDEYHKNLRAQHAETLENHRRISREIAHQFDIAKEDGYAAQEDKTDKEIDSREAEINKIFDR